MKPTIFSLVISLSLILISFHYGAAEQLNIRNNCGRSIYVKAENVHTGPFRLNHGQSRTVSISRNTRARVWAHTGCNGGGGNCDTTEGYVSLAEMHWDNGGQTWYDVSQVDGYNLPIRMVPYNSRVGGNCRVAFCNFNINRNCPRGNKISKGRRVVACKSPNRDSPNTDYSRAIKRSCPGVYSWSKDDHAGMRDCHRGNKGLHITFC